MNRRAVGGSGSYVLRTQESRQATCFQVSWLPEKKLEIMRSEPRGALLPRGCGGAATLLHPSRLEIVHLKT